MDYNLLLFLHLNHGITDGIAPYLSKMNFFQHGELKKEVVEIVEKWHPNSGKRIKA
jgi:hypothetical protein